MTSDEQAELSLLSDLQEAAMGRTDELERRLYRLEARLGIVSEADCGPGKTLAAEGAHDDREELVAEDLADWAGVPLAPSLDARRPALMQSLAAGFDAFSRGSEPSGTIDTSEAARQLVDLISEAQRRRPAEPDEPTAGDEVLQPHEYAGVPLARGW